MKGKKIKEILTMTPVNWLPYYVLYMQQQQRAKKAEEERKQAEEEARKAQEEAQKQAEQQQTETTEQKVEEPSTEKPSNEEQKIETTTEAETKKEETPTVSEKVEDKPQPTVVNTYMPKSTDCELLYEIGSSDYAACDYVRAQNAQANSNIAMMLMFCLAAGIGIAALIVHCVDRKVDEEYRNSRGGGYFLG